MKRHSRAKIQVAKAPRKRANKKIGKQDLGLEFVSDCDFCHKSFGLVRVRNLASVELNKRMPEKMQVFPLKDKGGYLFFCSENCRDIFAEKEEARYKGGAR